MMEDWVSESVTKLSLCSWHSLAGHLWHSGWSGSCIGKWWFADCVRTLQGRRVKKSRSQAPDPSCDMLRCWTLTLAGWRPVYHPEQCRLWCNFEAQGSGSMVNMHLESFGKNMKGFLKDPANTLDDCVGVRHGGVHHGKLSNATPFDFRSRNAEWGYRDIDEIVAEASKCGLLFQSKKAMPAQLDFKSTAVFLLNCLVFRF